MINKSIVMMMTLCLAFGLILPGLANIQTTSSNNLAVPGREELLMDAQARSNQSISAFLRSTPQPTHTPIAIAARITHTPKPTSTPLAIPPPSDPRMENLMILFGVLIVLVILFGVWLNRRRAF